MPQLHRFHPKNPGKPRAAQNSAAGQVFFQTEHRMRSANHVVRGIVYVGGRGGMGISRLTVETILFLRISGLEELASTAPESVEEITSPFDEPSQEEPFSLMRFGDDESRFRVALMQEMKGAPEKVKL
ncbi:hypothetical protein MMC14_007667, partial [Varicellaria rhodocarpa]|nr:hypothetical protein [Varicellaria rhodocarpa]